MSHMSPLSVEDVESIHPFHLEDDVEGLPAYEESVSSALSPFAFDDAPSPISADPEYQARGGYCPDGASIRADGPVRRVASLRLNEKEKLKRSYQRTQEHDSKPTASSLASPSDISSATSSTYSHVTALPPYQAPSTPASNAASHPSRSLAKKYGRARDAQITELARTGLSRVDFGSTYARQSSTTITSALSLYGGALVLFGAADGLRVADVSTEVPVRVVWTGLAVWDIRILRCVDDRGKALRGSVAFLCGGQEDPSRPGKPKIRGSAGDLEVRVWRLGSLASLAKWTAGRGVGWAGIDMAPKTQAGKGKGKERSFFPFKRTTSGSAPPDASTAEVDVPDLHLAKSWAADWVRVESTTDGKPADVVSFSIRHRDSDVFLAIATTSHILLHVGIIVPSGVSFRSTRKFYLPFAPAAIGLLDVLAPLGEVSLGIWISFGSGGMGMASVIRNSDSAVLDFNPPSGQGAGKGKGGWSEMQNIPLGERELYAFHRGMETIMYPSPLRLPIGVPPAVHTTWPRPPLSHLVVPDGGDLLLMTTSGTGEICTQRARPNGEGFSLDLQDGTDIGDGRILPLAWGYIRDSVYVSVKEMKEWRICALEKS